MGNVKKTVTPFGKTPSADLIDSLLKGSVDMHIHVPPENGVTRRFDIIQTVQEANRYGMRAVVLKNHNAPTTIATYAINRMLGEGCTEAVGSLVIEYNTTAGLNECTAMCVEGQAKMGCKMLWFPTFDAKWHRNFVPSLKGSGISILDDDGKLNHVCLEVLEVAKTYDMCVGSGHMSFEETYELFKAAHDMNMTKLVATHPMSAVSRTPYTMEQMQLLVGTGACIEHCWRNCLPQLKSYDTHRYVEAVNILGAENSLMSTDFAQVTDPCPAEGLRTFIGVMLQFGLAPEQVELMVKTNPYRLLSL